jgi:hypothetical protein
MVTLVIEDGTGKSNANTYVNQADATTYHDKSLYATDWTGATSDNKDIALTMATRLIDDYVGFEGRKVTDSQALEFPRFDIKDRSGYLIESTTIPTALKNAVAEMAKWLLASDRTAETGDKGFKNLQVGSLSLTPDTGDRAPVMPDVVLKMLAPFGKPFGGMVAKVVR